MASKSQQNTTVTNRNFKSFFKNEMFDIPSNITWQPL